MLLLLTAFLWLFVALLVLFTAFLLTPILFQVRLKTGEATTYLVVARPLGGFFPPMRLADSQRKKVVKKKRPHKPARPRRVRGRSRDLRPAISEFPDLMRRLIRAIHIDSLVAHGEFGLGDPAETGVVFGYLTPLIYGGASAAGIDVAVKPNFDRACFTGSIDSKISVVPVALLAPIIRFSWRFMRTVR